MNGDIDAQALRHLLGALGAHLEVAGHPESIVVVGGAALSLRGWIRRSTRDVDVIALVDERGDRWTPPVFSDALESAVALVARDYGVETDWLNAVIGKQWETGLPDDIERDIEWIRFGALRVGLAGRQTLITLKLFAAVDQWPASVHLQDLRILTPTDGELERARAWVERQDAAMDFPAMVAEVIDDVRRHR